MSFQPSLVPIPLFLERLRLGAGRRTLAIGLALLVEALLLLLLLSLGADKQPGREKESMTVIDLGASEALKASEPSSPERVQQADKRPVPQQTEDKPVPVQTAEPTSPIEAKPAPVAPPIIPLTPNERLPSPDIPRNAIQPAPARRQVYGPPDKGGSPLLRDSERVGTAPNGEPLYAAAWYRRPRPDQLRGYLSTADGPGWGLIACRTAPDYRVEDCVGLDEYPRGSQITRAVLAAAWEFKVLPPRLGGKPLVGSWVRIRIDYGIERR
ncbi:hypothetical protein IC614_09930 [Allosphingosinicella flava]|uniref:Uncharacterized protein n=1 Tax=Allosphingosinicella flava TaxID=2771430 RepID=A0A7T2LLL4_9SPHN|nr:hypothetical protein [Sphingosinicella flava]QPQ54640.1 hypothetical protein IC614_09930 [Sphingosinicella flava]